MTTEELKVVLRRSEISGFGFSLLGTTGPPHVIYDIVENSPAADCGAVEAGDVILKVNGTDVHRYTTKEVLKCLRLSDDLVTLELKRDPKLKAHIKEQLANAKGPHYLDIETQHSSDYHRSITASSSTYYAETAKHASLPSHSYEQTNSSVATENFPASRCKTTTANVQPFVPSAGTIMNVSSRHQMVTSPNNHSRSSSTSSVKIQLSENITNYVGSPQNATSPTSRPSRIPQAVKCSQKILSGHNSPHQKRSRTSHIPTKASLIGTATTPLTTNGNDVTTVLTAATVTTLPTAATTTHALQHSNSYSGSHMNDGSRNSKYRSQYSEEKDNEPISAPPQPMKTPRFEAYMMTGDLILNLSRTPQNSNMLLAQAKKVDSLRDSSIKALPAVRTNGALAPKASGESSPTSSSSIESSNHTTSLGSGNHALTKNKDKSGLSKELKKQQAQSQQQQQRDSFNNSFYNRKDSLTNDTLQMCEELERDDGTADVSGQSPIQRQRQSISEQEAQQQQRCRQRQQFVQAKQSSFEHYDQNDTEVIDDDDYNYNRHSPLPEYENDDEEENEEDQTNYDITNLETYDSGGGGAGADDEASDRQCLLQYDGKDDEEDSASIKQHLNALKQRVASQYKERINQDTIDYTRNTHNSGSPSSSITVGVGGVCGTNTSQDETSFSVPTSPISLSTPLIDKETANSMPTSPEPSNVAGGSVTVDCNASGVVVVRRHNGIVRTCDSAGFRTSKSEDHLQQIQREGMAAVIPIDIDEDVNSSLNTLLDTRQDSEHSQASSRDRIVWTYNAPLQPHQLASLQQQQQHEQHQHSSNSNHGQHNTNNNSYHTSHSSSLSLLSHNSVGSPASPTSVSSSVMSSSGSKNAPGIVSTHYSRTSEVGQQHQHQEEQKQQQQYQQQHQTQRPQEQQLIVGNGGVNASNFAGMIGMNLNILHYTKDNNNIIGGGGGYGNLNASTNSTGGGGGDHSVSEAISNISSPDYQDDDNLLSSRDLLGGMVLSDPSDSDSTILVSEAALQRHQYQHRHKQQKISEHKVVIQVRGADSINTNCTNTKNNNNNNNNNKNNQGSSPKSLYAELKDSEDELTALITEVNPTCNIMSNINATSIHGDSHDSSPPVSDDGSDVESLHSYHYSPKAVDMPSAVRLAKRLYSLDGFKKSDVSRHLSKNNDFSRAVADEYLKYFNFEQKTLDQSLREFLQQFSLSGETQERERVLVHFSKRYLDCNPGSSNSQDAVHTLTCALMLLNTDLHGQNIGRKMTCAEFIENLAELNDGDNFPKEVLKYLYQAIKTQPLEWALDDEAVELQKQLTEGKQTLIGAGRHIGQNPFLDIPESSTAVEYKKGYVMRKCCYDANYKKTPFGKRSWKMFYCTLRDLVLYLHKDEHGFRKSQMSDNLHNAIRIHHALATKASDYTKKQHVFRLQTADQAEYLFQTSDSKELQSWVETINFVCAAYSAPSLEAGVGSQKRFQRPLLPSTHTKLLMKEQLEAHEKLLIQLENSLIEHRKGCVPNKGLALQNYREKEDYLQYELRRYKAYVSILSAKVLTDQQQSEMQQQQLQETNPTIEESDKFPNLTTKTNSILNSSHQTQLPSSTSSGTQAQTGNRYNYRATTIYRSDQQQDIG